MSNKEDVQAFEDKVKEAKRELSAVSDQKATIIKDFTKQYQDLDAIVKDLEQRKSDLIVQINKLETSIEGETGRIQKSRDSLKEVSKAVEADSRAILEDARSKASLIIKEAEGLKEEAQKVLLSNNDKTDQANKFFAAAEKHLKMGESYRIDSEIILSDANKKAQDAITAQANAEKALAMAEVKTKALEAYEAELAARSAAIKEAEELISIAKQSIRDESDALSANKKQFADDCASVVADIEAKKAEIEQIREGLIKQNDQNKFRSAELDSGFSKLRREQEDVKKQKVVIDNMKKEFLNKGA